MGNSCQLVLDISEFKHLQELTICENRSEGDNFKGMVPFYALVDWHRSFKGGSQSLRKMRLELLSSFYLIQIVYKVAICPRGNLPYIQITAIVLPYR